MESNGPDNTKVRGPAAVVYERYQQYARDASSSGDRVLSENYLQHADHYFRLMRTMQPAAPPPSERFDGDGEYSEFQGDEEGARGEAAPAEGMRGGGQNEFGGEEQAPGSEQPRGDGDFRRRRGRRDRFRPGGAGGDAEGAEARGPDDAGEQRPVRAERDRPEQGERPPRAERSDRAERDRAEQGDRPPRAERGDRRERAPRERDEAQTQEGFSNGPRPAFLGSD